MLDGELAKWMASLGVGGVIAGFIFYFYRRDFIRERDDARINQDRILMIAENTAVALTKLGAGIEVLSKAAADAHDKQVKNFAELIQAIREEKR